MKFRHRPFAWRAPLAIATLLCISSVHAAPVLLSIKHEPQKQTNWCWASVSAMAGHAFGVRAGIWKISQLRIVQFQLLDVHTAADYKEKKSQIEGLGCSLNNTLCNRRRETWLFELDGSRVPEGQALTEAALIDEISSRHRPVIIKWDFSSAGDPQLDQPSGEHYLIITGYDPVKKLFRLYDPWSGAHSRSRGHTRWISYGAYLSPGVLLGDTVTAIHKDDVFNLRAGTGQWTSAPPDALRTFGNE